MTIVVVPTGFCNIDCSYCFEPKSIRNQALRPDLAAVERSLDGLLGQLGDDVAVGLHGGEATSVPLADLEALLKMIAERKGESAIQTNGYAITPAMIRLFQQYDTKLSISWDGPDELNRLRGPNPADRDATQRYTARLADNVQRLRDAGLRVGILVVLSRANAATDTALGRMKEWGLWLADLGITRVRMNPLFTNPLDPELTLTAAELGHAYTSLFDFVVDSNLGWLPFREMIDNLLGLSLAPCVYAGCNRQDTFVRSIFPDGRIGSCDRTFEAGLTARPADPLPNTRLEALRENHCKGCKLWRVCHGGCPVHSAGEGAEVAPPFCAADRALYQHIEAKLRGLLPNVRLVIDAESNGEPFEAMSFRSSPRPSSFAAPRPAPRSSSHTPNIIVSGELKRRLPMLTDGIPEAPGNEGT